MTRCRYVCMPLPGQNLQATLPGPSAVRRYAHSLLITKCQNLTVQGLCSFCCTGDKKFMQDSHIEATTAAVVLLGNKSSRSCHVNLPRYSSQQVTTWPLINLSQTLVTTRYRPLKERVQSKWDLANTQNKAFLEGRSVILIGGEIATRVGRYMKICYHCGLKNVENGLWDAHTRFACSAPHQRSKL